MSTESETTVPTQPPRARRPRGPKLKPAIPIDGDVLKPVSEVAAKLGISERTLKRMAVERTRFGGVLYVGEKAVARVIADSMTKPRPRWRRR
jgi:hypothetical protein